MDAPSGSSANTYQHDMFRLDPVLAWTPVDCTIDLGPGTEMRNLQTPHFLAYGGTGSNRKFSADDYSSPDVSNLEDA
jgi:hypothetical protein